MGNFPSSGAWSLLERPYLGAQPLQPAVKFVLNRLQKVKAEACPPAKCWPSAEELSLGLIMFNCAPLLAPAHLEPRRLLCSLFLRPQWPE